MGKWAQRRMAYENGQTVTEGTDKTDTRGVLSVLAVASEGVCAKANAETAAPLPAANAPSMAPRVALTDDHRAAIRAERDALVLALQAEAAARQCVDCAHLTRRRTCLEPEAAGLIPAGQGFGIAWPPEGHGAGCAAFSSKAPRTAVAGFNRSNTR